MVKRTLNTGLLSRLIDTNSEELPYDCSASVAQRLREDYYSGRGCSPTDLRIILGSPTRGVHALASYEEMRKHFREASAEEYEFRKTLNKTRDYRIKERERRINKY